MRVTGMARMDYSMYAFSRKYGIKNSPSSGSFDFSKIKDVDSYAKNLFEASGLRSGFAQKANGASDGRTESGTAGNTDSSSSASGTGQTDGPRSASDAGKTDGTSSASGTGRTDTVSSAVNADPTDAAAEKAGGITANDRKNVLNAYTSYMQSALASCGLDLLV